MYIRNRNTLDGITPLQYYYYKFKLEMIPFDNVHLSLLFANWPSSFGRLHTNIHTQWGVLCRRRVTPTAEARWLVVLLELYY